MPLLFESPVLIDAVTREYRRRITSTAMFLEEVPVRVPEVSAERAPLAMRAVDANGREHSYREFGGGLVRSLYVQTPGELMKVTADNVGQAMLALVDRVRNPEQGARRFAWPLTRDRKEPMTISREADWHEVVSTNRREARAACIETWQNGACCVDGEIFVPSRGPCWHFGADITRRKPSHPGMSATGTAIPRVALVVERGHLSSPREGQVFPPGKRLLAEIMIRATSRTGSNIGVPHGIVMETGIVGPTAGELSGPAIPPQVGLPVDEIAAAGKALLAAAAFDLAKMPTDTIRLFADATDAFAGRPDAFGLSILEDFHTEWLAWKRAEHARTYRASANPPAMKLIDPMEPLLRHLGRPGAELESLPAPVAPAP